MDIVEAINQRRSIRAFKSDPVPKAVLHEIVALATRAPSWGNTQPWEFIVVTGTKLEEIRQGCIQKAGEEGVFDIARPETFPEPYEGRRQSVGAKFMKTKGIKREDREGRGWWRLQGLRHFGAPCVIYIGTGRAFYYQAKSINSWPVFDCGLVAENIMLLATKYGLGTIPQAQAAFYGDVLRKVLQVPDSKLILLGISIGYPNWDDPINQMRSDREPLDKIAKWYGFD